LDTKTINFSPQHGAIFAGENVHKFLDWLDNLEVGKWEMGAEASDINKAVWVKWKKKFVLKIKRSCLKRTAFLVKFGFFPFSREWQENKQAVACHCEAI